MPSRLSEWTQTFNSGCIIASRRLDENNGLASPATIQPTSASHGEMTNKEERKIQFGGWNKTDYRMIRSKLRRRWLREFFDIKDKPRRKFYAIAPFTKSL